MIQSKLLKSILNDDHQEAYKIWLMDESRCRELISKSRIKNNFLRLLSKNNELKINGLHNYLEKEKNKHQLIINFTKDISKGLDEAKVNHAIIKGPSISNIYYDNFFDRKFSDIDILVSLEDKNKFYRFLDNNNLNHKNNIELINRIGYTRTAIEVIDSGDYVIDFHHRVISKFHKKKCNLTADILSSNYKTKGIKHTTHELNLAVIVYHACVQNNYRLDPYYLVDFDRIYNFKELNRNKLSDIMSKYNLKKHFFHCRSVIKKIRSDSLNLKESKKLFPNLQYIKPETIKTQINQILDPLPYMNIKANKKNFTYLEFLRTKFKNLMKQLA